MSMSTLAASGWQMLLDLVPAAGFSHASWWSFTFWTHGLQAFIYLYISLNAIILSWYILIMSLLYSLDSQSLVLWWPRGDLRTCGMTLGINPVQNLKHCAIQIDIPWIKPEPITATSWQRGFRSFLSLQHGVGQWSHINVLTVLNRRWVRKMEWLDACCTSACD